MPTTSTAKIWAYISNSIGQWLRQNDERERDQGESHNSKKLCDPTAKKSTKSNLYKSFTFFRSFTLKWLQDLCLFPRLLLPFSI
mgnify:CR=1 FL=1